jgi:mannose-6-phosphate isomerase-like protein (cupin superfamily)
MSLIRPMLVRADEAETLGLAPTAMRLIADGDATDPRSVSVSRSTMGRDTVGPPPHRHTTSPEMFFLLDGALDVLVGDEITTVRAGDFLLVPPHTAHAFATPRDSGVDMIFLMTGIERFGYFRLAERVRRGEAEPAELFASQDRFDNHLVDSPAWRAFRGTP